MVTPLLMRRLTAAILVSDLQVRNKSVNDPAPQRVAVRPSGRGIVGIVGSVAALFSLARRIHANWRQLTAADVN